MMGVEPHMWWKLANVSHTNRVQTFNSCTSRQAVCQCLDIQTPRDKSSTPMTHLARKSKRLSVANSSVYPYPGNLVAIRHAVVYYARAAHAFSAGIKCWHCIVQCQTMAKLACTESKLKADCYQYHNDISIRPHCDLCNILAKEKMQSIWYYSANICIQSEKKCLLK